MRVVIRIGWYFLCQTLLFQRIHLFQSVITKEVLLQLGYHRIL